MVDVAPQQAHKRLSRFTPWVNKLEMNEEETPKAAEVKQNLTRIEFMASGPVKREFECRVLQSTCTLTPGFTARRQKDPIFDAFNIGSGDKAVKDNAQVSALHRENVWHPHYEIQTEEEDMATKIRNR